jgi:hypothetical protein
MLHPTDAESVARHAIDLADQGPGDEFATAKAILALAQAVLALASATKYIGDQVQDYLERKPAA